MAAVTSISRHYHHHSVTALATNLTNETTSSIPQLALNQSKLPLPPRKRRQSSDFNSPFSTNRSSVAGSPSFPTTTGNAATDGCGLLKALISNILTFAT